MGKRIALYLLVAAACVAAAIGLLGLGSQHYDAAAAVLAHKGGGHAMGPLATLLVQIVVIIAAARCVGSLFSKLGQPAVIGEIVAGLLLGPSVLGAAAPQALEGLFPKTSLPPLQMLSQIGVLLFMFVVGMDVQLSELRNKAKAAVVISHTSIFLPFILGILLSLAAYPMMGTPGVRFDAFALFIGIAMSITAFPVLARLLNDRGLSKTQMGNTVLACAAVDDLTAWCLLAIVVGWVNSDGILPALMTSGMSILFILFMMLGVRPLLGRWISGRFGIKVPDLVRLTVAILVMLISAATTEILGIHALFGAFLAGAVMPELPEFRSRVRDQVYGVSSTVLLPLFFALTGLRTQVGLIHGTADVLLCLAIISVAVVGKLGGSLLAARGTGSSWNEAFQIGALMNTRGLIELIVLNIGYDLGILSPRIFTMMVIMALVTTFMTSPLLDWANRRHRVRGEGAALRT